MPQRDGGNQCGALIPSVGRSIAFTRSLHRRHLQKSAVISVPLPARSIACSALCASLAAQMLRRSNPGLQRPGFDPCPIAGPAVLMARPTRPANPDEPDWWAGESPSADSGRPRGVRRAARVAGATNPIGNAQTR